MENRKNEKILGAAIKIAEGQDAKLIDSVAKQIETRQGIKLLDLRRRPEAHYTTIKIAGKIDNILETLFMTGELAFNLIDFTQYPAEGKSVGSFSSVVFIPIRHMTISECAVIAQSFAKDFSEKFRHPVFFFEGPAKHKKSEHEKMIQGLSREELISRIQQGELKPWGKNFSYNPERGVTFAGIRKFIITLIAYLDTTNFEITQEISDEIGSRGRIIRDREGNPLKDDNGNVKREEGRFHSIDTMAVNVGEEKLTQIIFSIKDYDNPNLVQLYKTLQNIADSFWVEILGYMIVGYVSLESLRSSISSLPRSEEIQKLPLAKQLEALRKFLNLDAFGEFSPQWQIIDFAFIPFASP
ncbi:MAG: hypothetical protein P8184_11780 [Calditrichia bacterium]